MLVSGTQKITLFSCLALSMALFLPKMFSSARKEKEVLQTEAVGPGTLPAARPGYNPSSRDDEDDDGDVDNDWTPELLKLTPNPENFSRKKTLQKSPLLSQITPVYGFGIFLYIIYIFYKLTHKEQSTHKQCPFSIMVAEHMTPETSEENTAQRHTTLNLMGGQTERRSKCVPTPARCHKYRIGQEERKLQHLRKISDVLLERRMLEDVTPEEEAEETPYSTDWEGYPEETFPQYKVNLCRRRYPSVIYEESYADVPTPEELAERIESEEEEEEMNEVTEVGKDRCSENQDDARGIKGDGVLENGEEAEDDADEDEQQGEEEEQEVDGDQFCNSTGEEETPNSPGKEQTTAIRRRRITQRQDVEEDDTDDDDDDDDDDDEQNIAREEEREKDDPLMEAERLDFSTQLTWDPDKQEVDLMDFLLTYKPEFEIKS